VSLAGWRKAVLDVAAKFALPGGVTDIDVLARGHIHHSFVVSCLDASCPARFLFQEINVRVFRQPKVLMQNIELVTRHLAHAGEPASVELRLLETKGGDYLYCDARGKFWRAFYFIEGSISFDCVDTPSQAFDVGRAYGQFQRRLLDLDVSRLAATIPDFHNTAYYYREFEETVNTDCCGRVSKARDVVEFARRHQSLLGQLDGLIEGGQIPVRIAHNDAKLDNVLFDAASSRPLCVVDLDTAMPGIAIHDFGDLVRTGSGRFAEDELTLEKVQVDLELFQSLAEGYLSEGHYFLTSAELRHLLYAGKLITFETGIRFLTDYLAGDVYFQVGHGAHNLERARVQFTLLASIFRNSDSMEDIIQSVVSEVK